VREVEAARSHPGRYLTPSPVENFGREERAAPMAALPLLLLKLTVPTALDQLYNPKRRGNRGWISPCAQSPATEVGHESQRRDAQASRLVSPDTPVTELAKLMREHDIGAIPIGENDRLIGMVTDRDIVCKGLAEDSFDASNATARDVMTPGIHCCRD